MFNIIFKDNKEGYKFLAISIIITFIILFFSKFLGIVFLLSQLGFVIFLEILKDIQQIMIIF